MTTRQARATFRKIYGKEAYEVVSRIVRGKNSHRIEAETQVPVPSVAAYRANVTRGAYTPWADGYDGYYNGAIVHKG